MSGTAKQSIFRICMSVVWVLAIIAMLWILFVNANGDWGRLAIWVGICVAIALLCPISVLVHEIGHLLFGWFVGMKWTSILFWHIRISRIDRSVHFCLFPIADGACEMVPTSDKNLEGKLIFYALGGAILNFTYAGVVLALFVFFRTNALLTILAAFVPFNVAEGIYALVPVGLESGKTDGRFVLDLRKGESSAVLMARVMALQGSLFYGTYDQIESSRLYNVPVVREDDYAFLSLLQLRFQYENNCGDVERAEKTLDRLKEISENFSADVTKEIQDEEILFRMSLGCFSDEGIALTQNMADVIPKISFVGIKLYQQRLLDRILQARKNAFENVSKA